MNNENQNDELLSAFENPNGPVEPIKNAEPLNNSSLADATISNNTLKEEPVNQNQPDHLDVEPSVNVQQSIKVEKDIQDDPNFMKKNLKFILIIFALILVFIIFLPKIMGLFGNNY